MIPSSTAGPVGSVAHYSNIAEAYDASYLRPSHRLVYDTLAWEHASAIPLPHGAHVVDAGCGTGRWLPRWLGRGYRVTGIEQAPGMIATLQARRLSDRFTLVRGDMETAPIAGGSADLVLAAGSVQYVPTWPP